ncbi:hypothetical protein ACJX0J_040781, partial [Zea mays]
MIRWCFWIIASIRPGIELFCYGSLPIFMKWYDDVIIELEDSLAIFAFEALHLNSFAVLMPLAVARNNRKYVVVFLDD